jgi:CubicO group peptidase (beta-lactamase class C family)
VNTSVISYTLFGEHTGYGYQWWTLPNLGVFYASGRNGQLIFVVPEKDMVVVFTSGIYSMDHDIPISLFTDFILQADETGFSALSSSFLINTIISILITVPLVFIIYSWVNRKRQSR